MPGQYGFESDEDRQQAQEAAVRQQGDVAERVKREIDGHGERIDGVVRGILGELLGVLHHPTDVQAIRAERAWMWAPATAHAPERAAGVQPVPPVSVVLDLVGTSPRLQVHYWEGLVDRNRLERLRVLLNERTELATVPAVSHKQ
jgi:hypothetical protein